MDTSVEFPIFFIELIQGFSIDIMSLFRKLGLSLISLIFGELVIVDAKNLVAQYILDAVGSSRILIGKQKIGLTFNSDKLGGNDFTKFSKLTMCSA